MEFHEYLYQRILKVMQGWPQGQVVAISFLVHANELGKYHRIPNFPQLSITYNADASTTTDMSSEEFWNTALWDAEEYDIVEAAEDDQGAALLLAWLKEQRVIVGKRENEAEAYDENMEYIGKGPGGFYELLQLVADIARTMQQNGAIQELFGHPTPIFVHDLEYAWYSDEATARANPNGEADAFLHRTEESSLR